MILIYMNPDLNSVAVQLGKNMQIHVHCDPWSLIIMTFLKLFTKVWKECIIVYNKSCELESSALR